MNGYKCSVCGAEYKGSWRSIKKYRQPDMTVIEFLKCPKDGAPSYKFQKTIPGVVGGEGSVVGPNTLV